MFGSFVSAVSYRTPKSIGFVSGRSFCDHCKKKISVKDNIPLFSYLFLLGKSSCCHTKISIRYPLIELASGSFFLILYNSFHSFEFIYFAFLFLILLTVFVIDFENMVIFDEFVWLLSVLILFRYFSFENIFAGFLSGFLILLIYILTRGRGMGLGDVKLVIPLAAGFGLFNSLLFLSGAFILGGIYSAVLLLFSKAKLKTKISFGPFLIIAFWILTFYIN